MQFFATAPQPCPYLPARVAISLFADPSVLSAKLYSQLAQSGFRRSGSNVYRPACQGCDACIPVRLPIALYRPRRRDRRCLTRNRDLNVRLAEPSCSQEHFELYRRYLDSRHNGAGMDKPSPSHYREFLIGTWSATWFLEIRLASRLVAVAVTDRLDDGLSAVYTFYEPQLSERGLGNFAIQQQIETTRRLGLPYLYLGYWIDGSPKMAYKGRYRPLELYRDESWHTALP